jgi:ornithine--oxo-acid transaminase
MTNLTQKYIRRAERFGALDYAPLPVVLTKGKGVFVWDITGKRYFDMLSSYSALNQGHRNPNILKAATRQMRRLTLTSRAFYNDRRGDFLEKITKLAGFEKAIMMNTGAEAVETAIKAMRKWGYEIKGVAKDHAEIIVVAGNFHGRTTTIVGFSTDEKVRGGYGPATPGFKIIPYNDPKALENAINENTVGFLVEPIQGEGGIIIPDDNYLPEVREICTEQNIILCLDEIQTGLGRTGKLFCYEHYNIKPDMLVLGKALSGGFYPISCMLTSKEVMSIFTPGTHGSTFGGNPLAAAIGVAALDEIINKKLPEKAAKLGEYFLRRLKELKNPDIKEVRGKGLLIGLEFYSPIAREVCERLMTEGILAKDTHEKIIRFAPPLIIRKKEIDEAMVGIRKVLEN